MVRERDVWVFVEVKTRRSTRFGSAAEAVTPTKRRRLVHAATSYLLRHGLSLDTTRCRFDVVAIDGEALTWIAGAFTLDDLPPTGFGEGL